MEEEELEVIYVASGDIEANLLKSHLESKGIPVLLSYESYWQIFGVAQGGLSEVKIMVPHHLAKDAKKIIEPQEQDIEEEEIEEEDIED